MGPLAPTEPVGRTHRDLWEVVRDELRDLIIRGEFHPGERLVETALSERLAVSRGPVRVALKDLERLGLVTSVARRGTHVASFDRADIDELYDVTLALEQVAAREAASRVGPAEAARLAQLVAALTAAEYDNDDEALVASDLELHREIMRLSGNRRLRMLWTLLAEEMRFVIALTQRALPQVAWGPRNARIVEALTSGDAEAAEHAVADYFAIAHAEMRSLSEAELRKLTGRSAEDGGPVDR